MTRSLRFVSFAALLAASCVSPLPLDHRPCPCADGLVCCTSMNLCLGAGATCPAPSDAGAPDTSGAPDAACLTGTPGCPVAAPTIDGQLDDPAWVLDRPITKVANLNNKFVPNNTAVYGYLWNSKYLFVGVRVMDSMLVNSGAAATENDDSVEIYVDGDGNRGAMYDRHDVQVLKRWNDDDLKVLNSGKILGHEGYLHASKEIEGGYEVEIAIPWSALDVKVTDRSILGLGVGVNDNDDGKARMTQLLSDGDVNDWQNTTLLATIVLGPERQVAESP